jgi:molecular chaperone Hsp33
MTQMLSDGLDAAAITELLLAGLGVSPGAQTRVPSYGPCDAADLETRMRRAVVALGKTELQTIYEQEGRLQVTCEFCKISLEFDYEAVMPVAKG